MRSSPCLEFCQRILWLVSPSLFPLVLPFHTLEDIPEQERPSIGSVATHPALKRARSPTISSTAQRLSHLSLPARHRLSICFHSSNIWPRRTAGTDQIATAYRGFATTCYSIFISPKFVFQSSCSMFHCETIARLSLPKASC